MCVLVSSITAKLTNHTQLPVTQIASLGVPWTGGPVAGSVGASRADGPPHNTRAATPALPGQMWPFSVPRAALLLGSGGSRSARVGLMPGQRPRATTG